MARSFNIPKKNAHLGVPGTLFVVLGAIALAVTFVGLGFLACLLPPVTHELATHNVADDISPLPRKSLVAVADATREYSFFSHDQGALLQVIYDEDVAYAQALAEQGLTPEKGFPSVDVVVGHNDVVQLRAVFEGASERFAYSADTLSHLDDCYAIARYAYPILGGVALLAIAACIFAGVRCGKRRVGAMLIGAGVGVLVAFVAMGVWALVDFNGFFAAFHGVLFSQGNWTFPIDSLLICALPTGFWMGMGIVWLSVTVVVSILSLAVGLIVRKKR